MLYPLSYGGQWFWFCQRPQCSTRARPTARKRPSEEWLRRGVSKLKDMGGVLGMSAAKELTAIPGIDKQLESIAQRP